MAEIKDKIITVESLSALHEHNKNTYVTKTDVISIENGGTGADTAVGALSNLGITASIAALNIMDGAIVTTDELNYVSGVTSNIQNQLDGKQESITGGATTIISDNLTVNKALVSDDSGKVAVSDITSDELGCLKDVTSNIQTQLNDKADSIHTHDYLPLNGGALTNTLGVKGLIFTSGIDYGNDLPDAGVVGKVFFKKVGS